jgi:hypothetical protein
VIALYAITDHPAPPLPRLGTVHAVSSGDLAAVCGPVLSGEMTADALWQHERIVEALMDQRDVLPVRYGTYVSDDAAAARALADNHDAYAETLESVRGAVELAVRVLPEMRGEQARVPAAASPMTGTDYLRAQARTAAAEADASAIVHEPLARMARADTLARVTRPSELMRGAYLVDRDAVARFSARLRDIQAGHPELKITCTGPWPPYSFVTS